MTTSAAIKRLGDDPKRHCRGYEQPAQDETSPMPERVREEPGKKLRGGAQNE